MKTSWLIIGDDIFTFEFSNTICTTIAIGYQGGCFPDYHWNDFTSTILSMWTDTILRNRYASNVRFSLYFMDGPYRIDVEKDREMNLILRCINSKGHKDIVEHTILCQYYEFLKMLYDGIKLYHYLLYSHGLHQGKFAYSYQESEISLHRIRQVIGDIPDNNH